MLQKIPARLVQHWLETQLTTRDLNLGNLFVTSRHPSRFKNSYGATEGNISARLGSFEMTKKRPLDPSYSTGAGRTDSSS